MGVYTEAVQKLYVAYFSRPADTAGLAYWEGVVEAAGGDTSAVSAAFAASDEYKAEYAGKNAYQVIATVYQNLFGHEPDVAGLNFWGQLYMNGTLTIDKIVTDIAAGAQGSDLEAFNNKVAAATAFTNSLDTTAEILGYSGAKANAAAKTWLAGVTTDASLEAAIAPAALESAIGTIADTGLSDAGQEFKLTTGIDTFTGGAGNDTFVAVIGSGAENTLTALDTLNGGAGKDTLKIDALGNFSSLPSVTVNDIENVVVRGAGAITMDIRSWTGIEELAVTQASGTVNLTAGGSTDVDVSLAVKSGIVTNVEVAGGKNIDVALTNAGASTGVKAGNGATGTVNVEVTSAASGASGFTLADINVYGGSTINVVQNVNTSNAGVSGKATITQADVNVTGAAATTSVTVQQSATVAAVAAEAAVAAVKETTTLKFAALEKGDTVTVGGISFTANKDLTAAEVAAAFANLQGGPAMFDGDTQGAAAVGNGYYEGELGDWTSGVATGDTVTFTSTGKGNVGDLTYDAEVTLVSKVDGVKAAGATAVVGVAAGDVVISDAGGNIKTVTLDVFADADLVGGFSKLETLNLSNANANVDVADSADTLALNLNKFGTAKAASSVNITKAPVTLNVDVTGTNVAAITAITTEALNVSGSGSLITGAAGLAGVKTVKVTGSASLDTGATVLGATSIDASGTSGDVSVTIAGDVTTYAGAAGDDAVTIDGATTAITKAINLGAGDDTIDLSALNVSQLSTGTAAIAGGEGTDTLVLNSVAAQALSATAAFEAKISGFEQLEIGALAGDTTVNMDNLDDINYVIVNGAANAPSAPVIGTVVQGVDAIPAVPGTKAVANVTFGDLEEGQSITVAGITITATANLSAADVVSAFMTNTSAHAVIEGTLSADWEVTDETGATVTLTAKEAGVLALPAPTVDYDTPATEAPALPAVNQTAPGTDGTDAVAGVTEYHEYTLGALEVGQSVTIDGVTVTASGPATAADVAEAFRSLTSAGNLTVVGDYDDAWDASGTGSTLRLTSTETEKAVDDPAAPAGSGASGGTLTLNNMLNGATVELNGDNAVEINLKDATGTADVVNLIVNDGMGYVYTDAVETINVTSAGEGGVLLEAAGAKTVVVDGGSGEDDFLSLYLGAAAKSVTLVDASAAEGPLLIASSFATDAVAVTIKGGAGDDVLISFGDKADVLVGGEGDDILIAGKGMTKLTGGEGNDVFVVSTASKTVNSYATIMDFEAGDLIQFNGVDTFNAIQIELGDTAVFQDYANAAVNALGDGEMGWFVFGGNTYLVADMDGDSDNGFVDGDDFIVKIVGEFDLSKASFNAEFGTIGLV